MRDIKILTKGEDIVLLLLQALFLVLSNKFISLQWTHTQLCRWSRISKIKRYIFLLKCFFMCNITKIYKDWNVSCTLQCINSSLFNWIKDKYIKCAFYALLSVSLLLWLYSMKSPMECVIMNLFPKSNDKFVMKSCLVF